MRSSRAAWALALVAVVVACGRERAQSEPVHTSQATSAVAWSSSSALATPRSIAAGALVGTTVIVAGGQTASGASYTSSAEKWSPSTGTWSSAGTMSVARRDFTMTSLGARALAAGGIDPSGVALSTSEEWDGAGFGNVRTMASARYQHSAVALSTGAVVVAGGVSTVYVATAERYDPVSRTWSSAGTLSTARASHGAARVPGTDHVLIVGGVGSAGTLSTAELWNGSTWSAVGSLSVARNGPIVVAVGGKILVAGGRNGTTFLSSAELYDPVAKTFSPVGNTMTTPRVDGRGAELSGLAVLVGGFSTSTTQTATVDVWDPATGLFRATRDMAATRARFVLVPTADKRLVAVGGFASAAFLSSVEVYAPTSNGAACSAAVDCLSGLCVDGVCCNAACTGQCQACDVTGSVGTCSPVSGPPRGARPACASGYVCFAGACATSCTDDSRCASTHYCAGTSCALKKANGAACTAKNQCASGRCVDGVCCNSDCTGQCEACDVSGSVGTCSPVNGAPRGGRPVCSGVGVGTTCGHTCNGVDTTKCNYPPTTVACGADTCVGGKATTVSKCNGSGSCVDTSKDCGAYTCGPTACKTSCTTAADCIAGHACVGSTCTPSTGLGKACTTSAQCETGLSCVDSVCCTAASCGAGATCAYEGHVGKCTKSDGTACTANADCGSGKCVDGVCCKTDCTGLCESCNVPGKEGTCSPVKESPKNKPACPDGGGDACAARACDGVDGKTCAAFVRATEHVCKAAVCTGSTFLLAATCDGAGKCLSQKSTSCVPYACDDKGCKTSCSAPSDCDPTATCKDGKCIAQSSSCTDERRKSTSREGVTVDCTPYLCGSEGVCLKACLTSSDCQRGFVCDTGQQRCVEASPPGVQDDPSCSLRGARPKAGLAGAALLIAVAGAVRRRTRR